MRDIKPGQSSDGCSNLAITSRRRNKTVRKPSPPGIRMRWSAGSVESKLSSKVPKEAG